MTITKQPNCIAFEGLRCIAAGELAPVATRAKNVLDKNPNASILIFNDVTSEMIEVDFRGKTKDVLDRLKPIVSAEPTPDEETPRGPGRPKLGVIAREVTLLPRHWDWLNTQPGGASVALRKLVERAKHENAGKDQVRQAQESCYRFMSALAGNQPNYEEATRALFAGQSARFDTLVEAWPKDVRDHAKKLAAMAFQPEGK